MQANLTHHSATRKSLELVVPSTEVNTELGRVLAEIAPKVRIPGFRPGKAPKNVLLSRYQQEVYGELVETLVKRHFWDAAAKVGTQPISQPALEKAELGEDKEGRLHLHFDVAPEVQLPDYKNLNLTKKKRIIDEAAIDEHLEEMRKRATKMVPFEGQAAEGMVATFDLKAKPKGMKQQAVEDQKMELRQDNPFTKEIIGMDLGSTKHFTLTLPENGPEKSLAGKEVVYELHLKDLRQKEVPELNDEFAKDMGDYADLKALREFVAKDLNEAAERDAESRLHASLLDTLLDAAPFEVPASIVKVQLDDYCNEFAYYASRQGMDPKQFNWEAYRQSRKNEAERAVRSGYLLQAIGNAEDIPVSDEEVDQEIRKLMEEMKITESFETFKAGLEKRGSTMEIKGRVRTEKILDRVLGSATVKEELLDRKAFESLQELEHRREANLPVARFGAGGMGEGDDLEAQEGGAPAAVKSAEPSQEGAQA